MVSGDPLLEVLGLVFRTVRSMWREFAASFAGEPPVVEQTVAVPIELWAEAFPAAGLTDVEAKVNRALVTGRSGGILLTVRAVGGVNVLSISGFGIDPEELDLRVENIDTSVMKTLGVREIETGDPVFDEKLFVQGEPRLVHGLLDAETRNLLLALFLGAAAPGDSAVRRMGLENVTLKGGHLQAELPLIVGHGWRVSMLQSLLAMVRRLARPADPAFSLARNAREDPLESVRLVNLKLLVREYPGKPATLETLRAVLTDPGYGLRFRAASELGAEGLHVLLEIAADGSAPEATQVGALRAVGARLPLESAHETLRHALRTRRLRAAEACLVSLGLLGVPDVVDPLARVLAVERGRLAAAAARALGLSGQPTAEAPLVAGLQRQEVALASAVALGKVGSVAAVGPLREAESASSDDSLRRAAREAVAQIHSRLSGASPGQLSLTEEEAGQLSLTRDEAGRVSLPDRDPVVADDKRRRTS